VERRGGNCSIDWVGDLSSNIKTEEGIFLLVLGATYICGEVGLDVRGFSGELFTKSGTL
jgi:hypothetical protein